jgi:hypothetical protein
MEIGFEEGMEEIEKEAGGLGGVAGLGEDW